MIPQPQFDDICNHFSLTGAKKQHCYRAMFVTKMKIITIRFTRMIISKLKKK